MKPMAGLFTLSLVFVLVGAPALPAQRTAAQVIADELHDGWFSHVTQHWVILSSATNEQTGLVGESLERVWQTLPATMTALGFELRERKTPLACFLYADRDEYLNHMARIGRPASVHGLGGYLPASNVLRLILPTEAERRSQPSYSLAGLAAHEGAHQLVENLGPLRRGASHPPWLSEGLAGVFEVEGDEPFGPFADALPRRTRMFAPHIAAGDVVPLRELAGLRHPSEKDDHDEVARRAVAIYYQAPNLVHYLMVERPSRLVAYIAALNNAKDQSDSSERWRRVFEECFGDPEALQKDWTSWMLAGAGHSSDPAGPISPPRSP